MSNGEAEDADLSLEIVFDQTRDAWFGEVHTCFPARVDSYDAPTQTANLTPMVRRSIPDDAGGDVVEAYPALRAVRVAWFRAGGAFIHMPLRRGNEVHVHCSEADFSRWAQTGDVGEADEQIDIRRHHLTHAFCVPGLSSAPKALTDTPADAVVIGWDGGATVRIYEDGSIKVGTNATLKAATENVADHLTAISADLEVIALAAMSTAANYGSAAKELLDVAKPIAAQKVSVE